MQDEKKKKGQKMTSSDRNITTDGSFIGAVSTVHFAIADLVRGEADRGVVGTGVLGRLADSRLTGLLI